MGTRTRNFANNVASTGRPINIDVTQFDDDKIVNDLSTLALREATQSNRAAVGTSSQYIDVFQDSSGYTNGATTERNSGEYVRAATTSAGDTKILTKAKIYTNATAYAVWQFRGSNNASSWTNLGNTMNVSSNPNAYADSGYFSNTTAYRYYEFYKTDSAQGGQYHREIKLYEGGSGSTEVDLSGVTLTQSGLNLSDGLDKMIDNNTDTHGFHTDSAGVGAYFRIDFDGVGDDVAVINATGNFTCPAITTSSTSSMGAMITYQDTSGTNALNSDIVLQLSADNGSTFSTATLTAMPDFSSGIKMAKVNDLAVTAGTQLKYKISFANQSSGSKEARIRGVSLNY